MPASTSQPKRGPTRELLLAIKQQLVDSGVADESRIRWIARRPEQVPHFAAEKEVLLMWGSFIPEQGQFEAAGRVDTRFIEELRVIVRKRVELDAADSDEQWMLNADLSFTDVQDDVIDALQNFWPHDGNGDALTAYAIYVTGGQPPMRVDKDGWGDSVVTFAVVRQPPLDQDIQ